MTGDHEQNNPGLASDSVHTSSTTPVAPKPAMNGNDTTYGGNGHHHPQQPQDDEELQRHARVQARLTRKEKSLRRRRKRMRRRAKAVAVLPSLFTLGNLIAGFAAIYYASKPNVIISPSSKLPIIGSHDYTTLQMAGYLIFIGMFFDAIDGYVARLTRSASDIGAQLDSLADIVTFGVAPAYMTLQLVSKYYLGDSGAFIIGPGQDDVFARFFWLAAAVYVCCTALRLARFNVETASPLMEDHMFFRGLPSPGAAGCIASLILLHQTHLATSGTDYAWAAKVTGIGMAFILVLCAWGMVSRLPYVHFMNKYIRGHASFGYIVKLAIILAFASFNPVEALAIGFTAYALSAPSRYMLRIWQRGGLMRPKTRTPAQKGSDSANQQ